ncbi:hypothetical protein Tco_0631243 [Tanacetum coccineum]
MHKSFLQWMFMSIMRVTTLEKEVAKLKKNDPLNTQVTALVDEHLDSRLGATKDEFMSYLLKSITARITEEVKTQLPQILPKEVSNFAHLVIKSMITESLEHAVLAKESLQPKSTYEAAASLIEFELKKILIDKMDEMYSLKRSRKGKDKDEDPFVGSDRGLKKRKTSKDVEPTKEEPEFEVANSDMPQDQEENLGNDDEEPKRKTTLLGPAFKLLKGTRTNYAELEYDFEECYKALSEKLDWDNLEGGDYPFDLTKPLLLVMNGNHQMTFYGYARGLESSHDVYSTKRILAVTRVEVMKKHGYEYLQEIVVRRADNDLYKFKEGDFPRLCINDIEDMLILVIQNRLNNLSGNDVSDFAIALRMFTRSMVIQKRVEDLQLGVESCQKKIDVTKLDTTRPGIRKNDPFTLYQDPEGFIYREDGVPWKNDQGYRQVAEGKNDDEELEKVCWWETLRN